MSSAATYQTKVSIIEAMPLTITAVTEVLLDRFPLYAVLKSMKLNGL